MIKIGEINKLKVVRIAEIGYYLDGKTNNTSDDILLPTKSALGNELQVEDEVEAFIYRDSKDRIIATMKNPLAQIGEIAYLEVVDNSKVGAFISIGLERDVLVPFKEIKYKLEVGKKYLFYLYLDKTNRLAATTNIDKYLHDTNSYNIGEEVEGTIYGFQTNGTAMIALENIYRGVILKNEYYNDLEAGEIIKVRVKRYYEEGQVGVTSRKSRLVEKEDLETVILDYLKKNNGAMKLNDKSSPEDIQSTFNTSKNAFKRALGGLMKRNLIIQDENGTKLI
ncbi:S1 RNA binding domain protein [Clostridium argentinense CDC 2741]|uniref:S1 RNA binding domain protein n=1 Tax=Clostridium argentinense CDC 2741 TaxID=1418104 RepID=A0A0C1QTU7_9CLOT|nr:S1-like domain-containing RNA-binding protein [Clostridium argentinense]ARC84107.1 DNA-binding protein [Clostridium argentinense]KIE44407.1 S1 RNA binding domain protein [Clostridium argentinense CDC 2741]NFF39288.1 DNA-binding protein [Clostridium argentinense]NFP51469.1 DNA-binding protein [Clostridium argentinense]NFP74344.1 DNA-binding protein [Clostridium argentinense]